MTTLKHINLRKLIETKEYITDFAMIINPENGKAVVTERDLVHYLTSLDDNEPFTLTIYNEYFVPVRDLIFITRELSELMTTEVDIPDWVHYFGIKSRVQSNYRKFLKSIEEIGLDVKTFPDWNQK